ncbi:MAG TPA: energy transducer TonB [Lacunisphaera sp.]
MNFKNILSATVLTGGLLSATVASASITAEPTLSAGNSYTAPVPLKIVAPSGIARRFQGETVRLSLTIDATGHPKNISLLSGRDTNLERNLLPAVAQWQFAPATKNGRPVLVDVVLPLELVEKVES